MNIQNKIKNSIEKSKSSIKALSAYTIFTIILTYPVAFYENKIPGGWDAFQFMWIFWWFKKSLLIFVNPYITPYLFYPSGASLAFSAITPFNSMVSVPLQFAFTLVNTYKIIWILTFILTGYGTFLLVKYLTNDTKAAFIAGLIFMFSPYRMAHGVGHLNLISTEWIPFYVLFLIKTIHENQKSNAIYAALFLFLTALSCNYYLVYLLIFTIFYLLYHKWSNKNLINKNTLKRIGIIIILSGSVILPFFYPMLKELLVAQSNYMYQGGFIEYSADLLGFLVPPMFHPIFGKLVEPIYSNFTGNLAENTVFVGYTVIFLSIVSFLKIRTKEIKFWTLSVVIFIILSLGPLLHVNGHLIDNIPLPYSILMNIPIFSLARAPSRWSVLVIFSLAVLAGYGLNYIFKRYTNNSSCKKNVLFFIFSFLILFEFLATPYTMSSAEVPIFYKQISNEQGDYAILEIPNCDSNFVATYMYYQSTHEKKLVNGYLSRTSPESFQFLSATPFISQLMHLTESRPLEKEYILNQNITEIGSSILNFYNIEYIILHKDLMSEEQFQSYSIFLQRFVNKNPLIYEKDSLIVYKVQKEQIKSFMVLGEGWHNIENWNGNATRWMKEESTLLVYSDVNRLATLRFQTMSFYRPRTLEIYVDDLEQLQEVIPTKFINVEAQIPLKIGTNYIKLYVPEGCDKPSDIPIMSSKDSSCLSLAFQNVTIT